MGEAVSTQMLEAGRSSQSRQAAAARPAAESSSHCQQPASRRRQQQLASFGGEPPVWSSWCALLNKQVAAGADRANLFMEFSGRERVHWHVDAIDALGIGIGVVHPDGALELWVCFEASEGCFVRHGRCEMELGHPRPRAVCCEGLEKDTTAP